MTPKLLLVALLAVALGGCVDGLPGLEEQAMDHHDMADHADHGSMDAEHDAGHAGHGQTGMARPYFPQAQGQVPSAEDAAAFEQVSSLRIDGDDGFRPAAGVRSGSGTMGDPFVIEHWYVAGDLWLADTDACFEIREVYIGGQLSLNWNGICGWVHHNYINDLRVNENIARDGYATGGILEHNQIGFVGQLRHYDGEFRYNTVGPKPPNAPFDAILETTPLLAPDVLIANIDGFNQGLIHNNTFHGSVDLDFHGHHHGTGFFATHSHYHGDNESRHMAHDHTQRWTSVQFADNLIIDDEGYGLRYDDRNHAGDDRVANSEQEETLDLDHMHRSKVEILRNTVRGSGIWVDIFNADDPRHIERNDGWLHIEDNTVELVQRDEGPFGIFGTGFAWNVALQLDTTKEADIIVRGNDLRFAANPPSGPLAALSPAPEAVAIELAGVRDAYLTIEGNTASGFDIALRALRFEESTWRVAGNDWGSAKEIDADDSVPMPDA